MILEAHTTMLLTLWTVVVLFTLCLYFRQKYTRFSKFKVKHYRVIPPLGNMLTIMLKKEHVAYHIDRMYCNFNKERFIGRYEFLNPSIIIRDLELIKKIAIKDFEHFIDHRDFTDETLEPLFGRNLFSLRGQEWKEMRTFLSPLFTSSKIRHMVPFIEEVATQMIDALNQKLRNSKDGYINVDCKDLTSRSSNDVIASCAFGLKVDSHSESDNQFYRMGKITTTFNLRKFILFFAYAAFPRLFRKLKLTHLSKETTQFFIDLVLNTMKNREARNIIRPDMIHLLMEAKKGTLKEDDRSNKPKDGFATVEEASLIKKNVYREWAEIDLVAQAAIFLIAGFETVSTALTFTFYELAIHHEVQEKLFQEIKDFDAKHHGKLDYNSIQDMTYMDMVISEVLRKWPPLTVQDRECTKDYNLGTPNDNVTENFIVRKGEIVIMPTWSLHHDPQYFPNPEKFEPERFSEENKHLINPLTYMPFGIGPRNCIASRFALCELKVLLFHIIKNFEISPCEKTGPAILCPHNFNPRMIQDGHWLRFKHRC